MRDGGEVIRSTLGLEPLRRDTPPGPGPHLCPSCGEAVRITASGGEPLSIHRMRAPRVHDPETRRAHAGRQQLVAHFRRLFPSAAIGTCEPIGDWIADIAVLTGGGGRLLIESQASTWTPTEVRRALGAAEGAGAALLWLVDSEAVRITRPRGRALPMITLREDLTALIGSGRDLLLHDPARQSISHVVVHPAIPRIAEEGLARIGKRRIGKVECLVRTYPLSQLRLSAGMTCVLPGFDARPTALPTLPEALRAHLGPAAAPAP